ncbi:hypothetical protein HCB45_11150 [Listeria sp. FSL L7-0091]|uniref:hypothetical protein n=1 Tax=Listeria farberi TaxID=2713500 RepID=UPI0016256458|nr:hypothetical protein [Listeria farberi]MBC2262141.1 hypothetical protein [Listeria farberi]
MVRINKYYLYKWRSIESYEDVIKDNIEPPLWATHDLLSDARFNYIETCPTLYGNVTRLLTLARYISEEDQLFDSWFNEVFLRAQELFPNRQWPINEKISKNNMDMMYDSNQDPFIPREFYFTTGFNYQSANLVEFQNKLLTEANPSINDFFSTPENMINAGFNGVPYKIIK